jgi:shikimate dehydrogenase
MNGHICGTTQVLGIIGHPISHSLSPLMQNAVLCEMGLDAVFVPFSVTPGNLAAAVTGLRALGVVGFNVTIPHKEAILPLLDRVDADAARIGAVNTVKLLDGQLHGFNTDAPGFLVSLRDDLGFEPKGTQVLIVGAGGASRAAITALAQSGVSGITIANRSPLRAKEIIEEFKVYFPHVDMSTSDLTILRNCSAMGSFDLLLNTTSVGLGGTSFSAQDIAISRKHFVYDMVYGAEPTALVRNARNAGAQAVNGHGMLAAQGELALTLWLGEHPPAGKMKRILLDTCTR